MQLPMGRPKRHHVVIIGSGFGGLFAAKALRRAPVAVTVLAQTTHHLFQPLLYQVATGILSEGEIAPATREILSRQRNARVIQALVEDIDVEQKVVHARCQDELTEVPYDSLIVAAGAGQSYFGNDQFATFAPGMKSLDNALELRARIFGAFERAELTADNQVEVDRLLTFVVVGAGPTGVEMAGQIRELSTHTLRREFRHIDPSQARVLLLDGADQLLQAFGDQLGKSAQRALEKMGVEIRLGTIVTDVTDEGVAVKDKDGQEDFIRCACKVWAAGVQASPLGKTLASQTGAELDRSGRVKVRPDLSLPDHPEILVVGDMAYVEGVPGVAQGAIQEARYAAARIQERLRAAEEPAMVALEGERTAVGAGDPGYTFATPAPPEDPEPFKYFDKGSMATVSRFNAVVSVGPLRFTGFVAWLMWLGLHLLYIAGFKQRVSTLVRWFITFVSNGRSERASTRQQLAGRLALEQFGPGVSGPLLRGEHPEPEEQEPAAQA